MRNIIEWPIDAEETIELLYRCHGDINKKIISSGIVGSVDGLILRKVINYICKNSEDFNNFCKEI